MNPDNAFVRKRVFGEANNINAMSKLGVETGR